MKGKKILLHCGAKYHTPYYYELAQSLGSMLCSKFPHKLTTKAGSMEEFGELAKNKRIIISGSMSSKAKAYSAPCKGQANSTDGILIWIGHSMAPIQHQIKAITPKFVGQYGLVSSAFSHLINYESVGIEKTNIVQYDGHYMSLWHYRNPPKERPIQKMVAILPSSRINLNYIFKMVEHYGIGRCIVRFHPGSYDTTTDKNLGRKVGLIGISAFTAEAILAEHGICFQPRTAPLVSLLDSCDTLCSDSQSSVVFEFAFRKIIEGKEFRIVSKHWKTKSVRKAAIKINVGEKQTITNFKHGIKKIKELHSTKDIKQIKKELEFFL